MEFDFSSFLSVIVSLFFLEILLSVDNALVNASLAEDLPAEQRLSAVRRGIIFGAGFRLIALIFASIIIHNIWLKTIGALYLIFLMFNHLGQEVDEAGKARKAGTTYKAVIIQIALTNIAFSIDNVVSAVGLSNNIYYIIVGVMIGIAGIVLMSQLMLKIVNRYPRLATAAYIIVGLIGVIILIEDAKHIQIGSFYKFLMISGIIGLTLWYEHSHNLRKLAGPFLHKLQIILGLPGDLLLILRGVVIAALKTR